MAQKMAGSKRAALSHQGPSKKRKIAPVKQQKASKAVKTSQKDKGKGKERAWDKGVIDIPNANADEDEIDEISDDDLELLREYAGATGFLENLDRKGIARSKKETGRLHQLVKPIRKKFDEDDLPSVNSNGEDSDSDEWSSNIPSDEDDDDDGDGSQATVSDSEIYESVDQEFARSLPSERRKKKRSNEWDFEDDVEMAYETNKRHRPPPKDPESENEIDRLPIKLSDGRVLKTLGKVAQQGADSPSESNRDKPQPPTEEELRAIIRVEDVTTGARFGRPAVIDVVTTKSRKARIQGAKDQIAGICQDILADPENSLGLLRRLHTFSLSKISSLTHPEPVDNDPLIRQLAILSQLAIFKDVIPGYRIRALTDKEKAEKVSQMVARQREWEQGFIGVYQAYLKGLEAELKARSELEEPALQCMCTLLVEATHFNFRENIISCVVARLSRRSWDESSELCSNTLIKLFRQDNTGVPSLETVRLLNRMIKERKFNVHPSVLTCLLHLRLKTELGVRASDSKADKVGREGTNVLKGKDKGKKGKKAQKEGQVHLSKKAKKVSKERQEIEKEMREAAAEVDKEERATAQTETLKLLFVLYFRTLKNPTPTPLLPAALQGISRYAHLVNIDFFKDLMQVLKGLILRDADGIEDHEEISVKEAGDVRHRLLCIVTAFELLSGQGEALNIDLSDFVNLLYALILPLSLLADIETPSSSEPRSSRSSKMQSTSDMLFRALNLVFSPKQTASISPSWRSAAFTKRLLTSSLTWPPATAIRAISFVEELIVKDPKLEALISTEDRRIDGAYRPDVDDPQLSNPFGTSFWELRLLEQSHWDSHVREEAAKLLAFVRH